MWVPITLRKTRDIFTTEDYLLPFAQIHMVPIQTQALSNVVLFNPKNRVHEFCSKFG